MPSTCISYSGLPFVVLLAKQCQLPVFVVHPDGDQQQPQIVK